MQLNEDGIVDVENAYLVYAPDGTPEYNLSGLYQLAKQHFLLSGTSLRTLFLEQAELHIAVVDTLTVTDAPMDGAS